MVSFDPKMATPLIRLARFAPDAEVLAKAEHLLVSGSIFDRIAGSFVERAGAEIEAKGTVVVAGSGSACLAFACALARAPNAKVVFVSSDTALAEHRSLLRIHRAKTVLVPGLPRSRLVDARAVEEARAANGVLLYTPWAEGEAEQLFASSAGRALADLVASIPSIEEIVVPAVSPALIRGIQGALDARGLQARVVATATQEDEAESLQDDVLAVRDAAGIGAAEVIAVSDLDAWETRRALARTEGLLVGVSSAAAIRHARTRASQGGGTIAVVIDSGDRYFSIDRRVEAAGGTR